MRARIAVALGLLAMAGSARADVPEGTPVFRGTFLQASAGRLQVRMPDGQQRDLPLAQGAAIALASPLPRAGLAIGQLLSVNAEEVRLPGGRVLIAGVYIQADPSVAPADRERLTRLFLPASGSTPEPHVIASGRLASVEGTSITLEDGNDVTRVKLLPEARGLLVRFGHASDLGGGRTVTLIMSAGQARAVLTEQ